MRTIVILSIIYIIIGFVDHYKKSTNNYKNNIEDSNIITVEVGPVELDYVIDSIICRKKNLDEETIKIDLPTGPLKKETNNYAWKSIVRLTPEQYKKLIQFRLANGIHFNEIHL